VRPRAPVVVGYHGCDRDLAADLISGKKKIKPEKRRYHWLGSGVYFWENDEERALEWAYEKASRGEIKTPAVTGGVIELRRCLDPSIRENVPLVKAAYDSLTALYAKSGDPMPENKKAPKDECEERVMRFLDCAVLDHLVENSSPGFDTVRGLFVEGGRVYTGAEIYNKTHAEIAVRNLECIRGLFWPI
jgi:hypothetical protein